MICSTLTAALATTQQLNSTNANFSWQQASTDISFFCHFIPSPICNDLAPCLSDTRSGFSTNSRHGNISSSRPTGLRHAREFIAHPPSLSRSRLLPQRLQPSLNLPKSRLKASQTLRCITRDTVPFSSSAHQKEILDEQCFQGHLGSSRNCARLVTSRNQGSRHDWQHLLLCRGSSSTRAPNVRNATYISSP